MGISSCYFRYGRHIDRYVVADRQRFYARVCMKLEEYLRNSGESIYFFANRAGMPRSTVWRLINMPGRSPNARTLHKLCKATDNQVGLSDFRPE